MIFAKGSKFNCKLEGRYYAHSPLVLSCSAKGSITADMTKKELIEQLTNPVASKAFWNEKDNKPFEGIITVKNLKIFPKKA